MSRFLGLLYKKWNPSRRH